MFFPGNAYYVFLRIAIVTRVTLEFGVGHWDEVWDQSKKWYLSMKIIYRDNSKNILKDKIQRF